MRPIVSVRVLWTSLLLLLAPPALAFPPAAGPVEDPEALGPFAVGRMTFSVNDSSRGRVLPVDAWYPVDAVDAVGPPSLYDLVFAGIPSEVALDAPPVSSAGPFPLVVFSHGNNGIRFQSFFLTEHLASHGFVVVAPDHIGNTAADLLLPGTPFETRDRPLDLSFLITRMIEKNADPSDPFFERLRRFRIGVLGHSFGGFTTLAMAGGFEDVPPDPRVRAILPISPVATGFTEAELASIERPALILGGSEDTITPIEPQSVVAFEGISSRPRWRIDLTGAGHNSFTNLCDFFAALEGSLPPALLELFLGNFNQGCAPELIPPEEAHQVTNLYATAFMKRTLELDPRYQRFLIRGFARRQPVDFFFVFGIVACGIGFELALVLPPLLWWHRTRRRR